MQTFQHTTATSVADTIAILSRHGDKAKLMAGGTDLLGILKTRATVAYPHVVVNIKSIAGLDEIKAGTKGLALGALARLADIADSDVIRKDYPILAEAAASVAMPQIRNMGTLGGNLAQETRCWYYRYPHAIGGRIMCKRKREGACLAVAGDNRYHAIFGGKKCFAVCPSDMAVALATLDAEIKIDGPGGQRSIPVTAFYHPLGNVLAANEIITEIVVPLPPKHNRQVFIKHRDRNAIDFATVSLGLLVAKDGERCVAARVVLGAVAPGPYRAAQAEAALKNQVISSQIIDSAAAAAVVGATPLSRNGYKIDLIKALLKSAVSRLF